MKSLSRPGRTERRVSHSSVTLADMAYISALEQTAASHSLAAVHRERWRDTVDDADPSIDCQTHGRQAETFVCRHIVDSLYTRDAVGFHWPASATGPRPDAWCSESERARFEGGGEWTDALMSFVSIQLLCGACYDVAKDIWLQARASDA